jgi:release factor glutamine methyltransferase
VTGRTAAAAVDAAVAAAEATLRAAGVRQPRRDAEVLAAAVLRASGSAAASASGPDGVCRAAAFDRVAFRELVERRAARVPLEQLLGTAVFAGADIAVGPGVFIPQPQSEAMLAWCLGFLDGRRAPAVIDLCTGSGAVAIAVARARPDATVHGVDIYASALAWARRNADAHREAGGTPVTLHVGDVGDPQLLAGLDACVDLVVCNPPYKPTSVPLIPEFALHQPAESLYAGESGLDVIGEVVLAAGRLLRPGGAVAVEHDVRHVTSVPALLATHGFTEVTNHPDADGAPRFTTGRRALPAPEPNR